LINGELELDEDDELDSDELLELEELELDSEELLELELGLDSEEELLLELELGDELLLELDELGLEELELDSEEELLLELEELEDEDELRLESEELELSVELSDELEVSEDDSSELEADGLSEDSKLDSDEAEGLGSGPPGKVNPATDCPPPQSSQHVTVTVSPGLRSARCSSIPVLFRSGSATVPCSLLQVLSVQTSIAFRPVLLMYLARTLIK
jgi:hypothetical protein